MGKWNTSRIKIEGAAELEKKLKELGTKTAAKILRKGTRAGAKPILAEVKVLSPVKTGKLKRAFTIRALKRMRRGTFGVKVTTGRKGPHAHLVELGTNERYHKDGSYTGFVKPMRFMRQAFEKKKDEAVDRFIVVVKEEIAKAVSGGS